MALLEKRPHRLCDLKDSIRMNINLIIKTHYNENRFDQEYGCLIWNKDYSTITNIANWKDELKSHMTDSIEQNEPRLQNIKINLDMEDTEISEKFRSQPLKLKKKITIQIFGIIKHLNEPFEQYEYLFFSPLSVG
jgi:phage baseplate assembly protein W